MSGANCLAANSLVHANCTNCLGLNCELYELFGWVAAYSSSREGVELFLVQDCPRREVVAQSARQGQSTPVYVLVLGELAETGESWSL
jgi:hypothetical protein